MTDTTQYLCLKQAQAAKTGERSTGCISYSVLCDMERQSLYLVLTANESGGWFSNEIVPMSRIEEVLATLPDSHQPLPSKVLRPAFISQSVNNSGFLKAVLLAEKLLIPANDAAHQHVLTDDWDLWKGVMLSEPGVPYVPTVKGVADTPKPEIPVAKNYKSPGSGAKRKGPQKAGQGGKNDAVALPAVSPADLSETPPALEADDA